MVYLSEDFSPIFNHWIEVITECLEIDHIIEKDQFHFGIELTPAK